MGKKLRVIEGGRVEAEKYVLDAKKCKLQYEALRKEHNDMQELHLGQARLIQTLQKQNSEINKFKDTVLLQEKVIAKMQAVVETRLMPPVPADLIEYDGSNAHERVAEEIYKLNLMIDEERKRQKDLEDEYLETIEKKKDAKKKIWDLETGIGSQKAVEKEKNDLLQQIKVSEERVQLKKNEIDHMETEINTRDLRLSALEEQMVMAARLTAQEIGKLKTKLFNVEISMTGMNSSESVEGNVDDSIIMKHHQKEVKQIVQDGITKIGAATLDDTPSGNATNAAQFLANIKKHEQTVEVNESSSPSLPSLVIDTTVETPRSSSRKLSSRKSSSRRHSSNPKSRKTSPRREKALEIETANLGDSFTDREKSSLSESVVMQPVDGAPQKPSTPKGELYIYCTYIYIYIYIYASFCLLAW